MGRRAIIWTSVRLLHELCIRVYTNPRHLETKILNALLIALGVLVGGLASW